MFSFRNIEQFTEKECTPRCRSRQHAELIMKSAVKGSSAEIRSFCNWLCHNFTVVMDVHGRNLLHVAASCGKWEIVDWLLNHCHCEVDVRDAESGWTALHRSFFYGQLTAARILLNQGANIRMTDHEGLTPLDLIIEDRLPYIEYNKSYPQEVYVWGSNVNYNLGLGNQQSRAYPESLEFFNKCRLHIKQVAMCKFHTVFLTSDGKLFTCGHGQGGRLGQGSEVTGLTPSPVRDLDNSSCLQIAAGQDHLVLLMEGNQIWTCGLNTYHQLGHIPPPEYLAIPKQIPLKFLKDKQIVSVCAARFHSVFYTKNSVYTFGLNAGQLGHPKGDRTQIVPRHVSGIYNKEWLITHVAASDGATVCATNQGDVYVLHEYQHRKIASKQIGIQKLSVIGGHLDTSCDAAGIREGGGLELRVMLLMKSGKLYLWRQTNSYLRRCLFTCTRQLVISDVHINHFSVAMVTEKNQCYVGTILPFKGKNSTVGPTSPQSVGKSPSLNCFIDRDECYNIRIKRLPYVHRATVITSDSKGRNFAILQALPIMGLLELPTVSESNLQGDMLKFLEETFIDDTFHDVIIKVGHIQYAAHKYILMSRSEYFKKLLMNSMNDSSKEAKLTIDNVKNDTFEQILKFLYCNTCDFLIEGKEIKSSENLLEAENIITKNKINEQGKPKQTRSKKSKPKNKDSNPLKYLQETSKKFNLHVLTKVLEYVVIENGRIKFKYSYDLPKLRFNRQMLNELCDVNLHSDDNVEFPCHKCILAARSDYFHSMLGSSWIEDTQSQSLTLPISSSILDILLHYLYCDDNSRINSITDAEFLCHVLAVADQLLLSRMKEMCEIALVNLLTLKNACDMLQLAAIYNAEQLKKSCMEYVCINLPAIIEINNLEMLSDDIIEELSRVYRVMIPSMRRRIITPSLGDPTRESLKEVEKFFPIQHDCDIIKPKIENYKVESKSKRKRTLLQRLSSKEQNQENRKELVLPENRAPNIEILLEKNKEHETTVTPKRSDKEVTSPNINKKENQGPKLCLSLNNFPTLEKQMSVLQKSSTNHADFKKVGHLSQKQKKRMAAANSSPSQSQIDQCKVHSPPPQCAWGKAVEETSSSPSFWDAFEKGLLRSPSNTSISDNLPTGIACSPTSPVHIQKSPPVLTTLYAIQKAEEEEQQFKMTMAKIKPLHLINIEDQAIEELLELYKAKDNPNEKITVSRILPERIADPVWKKHS